jgi:protein-tyrosine-phosphatase
LRIVTLCTGNATRSVIAEHWLHRERPDLTVSSAGTLSIEGLPASTRTRNAMAGIGLDSRSHRSHQFVGSDLSGTDLILAMEIEHVQWIRREYPDHAHLCICLRRLNRDLVANERPFAERLADLAPAAVELERWEDVVDPAGGEQDAFDKAASEIDELLTSVVDRL